LDPPITDEAYSSCVWLAMALVDNSWVRRFAM